MENLNSIYDDISKQKQNKKKTCPTQHLDFFPF